MAVREFVWDKLLSVEVEEIDADHRGLVDLFNLLARAAGERRQPDYVAALLEELIVSTEAHFRHEERLMIGHAYPELQAHATEHRELIDAARALQKTFLAAGRGLEAQGLDYLEHWLTEHILVADMRLGVYLASRM
jgi:hemerythrin-like metal-binding protein